MTSEQKVQARIDAMALQRAITTGETHHGGPGETCILPEGTVVDLRPAAGYSGQTDIRWWAHPAEGHPLSAVLESMAECAGLGLYASDVELLT